MKNYYQELFSVSLPASDKCLDSTSLFQRSYTKRDTSKICQARHLFVITSWDTDKQLPSNCYAFPCKSVTSPHSDYSWILASATTARTSPTTHINTRSPYVSAGNKGKCHPKALLQCGKVTSYINRIK